MRSLSGYTPYIYSVCLFSKGGNKGIMSVAKGINVMPKGMAGVAKGINMMAKGMAGVAKGINVMAKGMTGVAKGINMMAMGMAGVAKGSNVMAMGKAGMAKGMTGMAKYSRFRDEKLNSKIIVVSLNLKPHPLIPSPKERGRSSAKLRYGLHAVSPLLWRGAGGEALIKVIVASLNIKNALLLANRQMNFVRTNSIVKRLTTIVQN